MESEAATNKNCPKQKHNRNKKMKTKMNQASRFAGRELMLKLSVLSATTFIGATAAQASADYGPAILRLAYKNHWYNSGSGHKFLVIHDMEGYYWTTISFFQQQSTTASVHYCVNGKNDGGTDSPAGEITQMVLEKYYAWHALCWNTYSAGTEHEGFVSNPAWFTWEMYKASSALQKHMCTHYAITVDRNHVVGHNEKSSAAWVTYATANFGINATCNSHTDPGQYWNWSYLIALMQTNAFNLSDSPTLTAPGTVAPGSNFTATVTYRNISSLSVWTNTLPNAYRLGSQSPQDNTTWGFSRVDMPTSPVVVGSTVTFTLNCTAPITPAAYTFAWEMVQDNVQWFGPVVSQTITVGTPPSDIIIDNPSASVVGSWSTGTSATDKYGADYRYKSGGGGSSYLEYAPAISTAGNWNVYEWHSHGSNRTTGAQIQIFYNGGTATATLNQQANGGVWNLLGNYNFALGGGNVRVTDGHSDTGQIVIADAIRWVWAP